MISNGPAIQTERPRKMIVRLSGVADLPRRRVEVMVYPDGRVFMSEIAWHRLHDPDHRIAERTGVELRGSIDIPNLTLDGIFFRSTKDLPGGHVEVTVRREGHIAVLFQFDRGVLRRTRKADSAMVTPRRLARNLIEGRVGEPIAEDEPADPAYICPQCGNTGKVAEGACWVPRCIERRATTPTTSPTRRRLVHQ